MHQLTFENRLMDFYLGQHCFKLIAKDLNDKELGEIAYILYKKEVHVQMISAHLKRQGVGSALVLELQKLYPEISIEFGYVTDEGIALLDSLEWRTVENEDVLNAISERDNLQSTLKEYEKLVESAPNFTTKQKQAILNAVDDWNDIQDRVDELEKFLAVTPASSRFVVFDEQPNQHYQPR